jgi:hypothetical protein
MFCVRVCPEMNAGEDGGKGYNALEPYLFVLEEWSGFWREFTTSIPPPKESFIGLFVAILIAPF